jgi:hypothetical protein
MPMPSAGGFRKGLVLLWKTAEKSIIQIYERRRHVAICAAEKNFTKPCSAGWQPAVSRIGDPPACRPPVGDTATSVRLLWGVNAISFNVYWVATPI